MKDAPAPRPNKRPRLGPSPSESSPIAVGKESIKPRPSTKAADPQFEEFAKAIRPRTRKGPSWANEDPVPSTSSASAKSASNSKSRPQPVTPVDDEPGPSVDGPGTEGLSDLDWLKRHTKSSLDDAGTRQGPLYEQSGDEDVEEEAGEVFIISFPVSHC